MIAQSLSISDVKSFLWQHTLLLISLFMMTFGVVLCIKSGLGSSTISSIPFVMSLAGSGGSIPAMSVGSWTIAMNFLLVFLQLVILRRQFEPVQLFQLLIGFVFGWMIDLNMWLLSPLECSGLAAETVCQLAGCTVMGIGIAFEVKCGSVTMPGEGITIAIGRVVRRPFAKVKICVDSTLVIIAVALGYMFFGRWMTEVVGPGTIFAMVYVGLVVKFITPRIGWFDRLLHEVPGFRRTVVGLARHIFRR